LSLYRYTEPKWAEALVDHGSVLFSSLSWFQELEDPARADEFEGVRKYLPADGLEIGRVSAPPTTFVDPHNSFQAAARERDRIFVYCVSRRPSPELAAKFAGEPQQAAACVEIYDVELFHQRLARALGRRSPVQRRTLFRADVSYYSFEKPPGAVWALPAKLATYKDESRFADEEEHRFVFSTDRNAFKPERVEVQLVGKDHFRRRRRPLDAKVHRVPLTLGPLSDCCRIVSR
jgi:hypothetical protein